MVRVKLKSLNINKEEMMIASALVDTIGQDLKGLKCQCNKDSTVFVIVNKNKISAIRTEVVSCCSEFKERIEDTLYAVEA